MFVEDSTTADDLCMLWSGPDTPTIRSHGRPSREFVLADYSEYFDKPEGVPEKNK